MRKKFGEPAGGSVDPSKSDGNSPPKDELRWKHTCVAGNPARIAAPLYAHTCAPVNLFVNMLNET